MGYNLHHQWLLPTSIVLAFVIGCELTTTIPSPTVDSQSFDTSTTEPAQAVATPRYEPKPEPIDKPTEDRAGEVSGLIGEQSPFTQWPIGPRTIAGRSVFDSLPAPKQCDRSLDPGPGQAPGQGFALLAELPQEEVENPFLGERGFSIQVRYQNEKLQTFLVLISGANQRAVREYIDSGTKVCFEAIRVVEPPPELNFPIRSDSAVLDAAETVTKVSLAKLRQERDRLSELGHIDLTVLISKFDGDVEKALEIAKESIDADILQALDERLLTAEEAMVDVEEMLVALLKQRDAPFLYDASQFPRTNGDFRKILLEDSANNLVISLEMVDPFRSVVWIVIDPPINRYGYHFYRSRCITSLWASVYAWSGSMSVYSWRLSPALNIGSKNASDPSDSFSGWLYHSSSPQAASYDTGVFGIADSSWYSIYGGWGQGFGGERCAS